MPLKACGRNYIVKATKQTLCTASPELLSTTSLQIWLLIRKNRILQSSPPQYEDLSDIAVHENSSRRSEETARQAHVCVTHAARRSVPSSDCTPRGLEYGD